MRQAAAMIAITTSLLLACTGEGMHSPDAGGLVDASRADAPGQLDAALPDGAPPDAAFDPCAAATSNLARPFILPVVERTEHWIAYEAPTDAAISLAWAGETLWMADLLRGTFYKARPAAGGLEVVGVLAPDRDPFVQARDLAWDGSTLWSMNWGDLDRHDVCDPLLPVTLRVSEDVIGAPNLHHMKALAWDGETFWSSLGGTVYRHDPVDHSVAQTWSLGAGPVGMDIRDGRLWTANRNGGFIDVFDLPAPGDAEAVRSARYALFREPFGIAWSPERLWVYDWYTRRLYEILELPTTSLVPGDSFFTGGAATPLPEIRAGDTVTLTADRSPYLFSDGYYVPTGSTLVVEPGVTIYADGPGPLAVNGRLIAEGAADAPITFTHRDWDEIWGGLRFNGPEASASRLAHAVVLGGDNGISLRGAVPAISYSIIRRSAIAGLEAELDDRAVGELSLVGNHFEHAAGVAVIVRVRPEAQVPRITLRGNRFAYFYAASAIIEAADGSLASPPEVVIEHNVFERGYRGAGGGFPIQPARTTIRHNWMRYSPSGNGLVLFGSDIQIDHNLIEHVFERAYQLHAVTGQARFEHNTVRAGGFDGNYGLPSVVVEQNNLLFEGPAGGYWTEGVAGYDSVMPRNWWGVADVGEIHERIYDHRDEAGRGSVVIEPILTEPNGVGFVHGTIASAATGRPLAAARVRARDWETSADAAGEFFAALPAGASTLTVSQAGYVTTTVEVTVTSGDAARASVVLEPSP